MTFSPEERAGGEVCCNHGASAFPATEGPGIGVFCNDDAGSVHRTCSSYVRGLDMFIGGACRLLDIVPKGRDEEALEFSMEWIRHRDRYEA